MYLMWEKILTETVPRPTPADTLADKTVNMSVLNATRALNTEGLCFIIKNAVHQHYMSQINLQVSRQRQRRLKFE